jgi:preprotein translocase SecE subunit
MDDVQPWFRQVPLLGEFGPATLVAVILQALVGLLIYRFLNRPKSVSYLVETEDEMRKVVWPSWKDTWSGASAVIVTVLVMLVFLVAVDALFLEAVQRILR